MRQILFRGKRVDNGEWVYGFLTQMWAKYHIVYEYNENVAYEVVPETVGQYTGLVDKNDKKIFEGDIIRFEGEKIAYKVEFTDGCFSPFDCLSPHKLQVIGNVYENPELRETYND